MIAMRDLDSAGGLGRRGTYGNSQGGGGGLNSRDRLKDSFIQL